MIETAIYKGTPGTYIQGVPYVVLIGVSAAGYTVTYDNHKPMVYRTLRAFSDNWTVQAKENKIKELTTIPKIKENEQN